MEMPVGVDTSFGGLTSEAWDGLAGGHFYSTSRWLRYCANDTGSPGEAVVTRRADAPDEPAWGVPVSELASLPSWSRYRWNDHLAEFGLPLLPPTGTLVGASEGFQTHFLSAPAVGRSTSGLADLVAELRRPCDAGGRACVAMYVTTEDVLALREAGVKAEPVALDADAWIRVPDGGWDAWLETFPGKRRRTIAREERRFSQAGYTITHRPLAEVCDRMGAASASTLRKYGHQTTEQAEVDSLRLVAESMGDAAQVAILSIGDGDPVGFCIYYLWGDVAFLRWGGFDYDKLVGATEYFNLAYYCQVRRAPELGIRWIHAGATAQAAKALRGAELRPLWMVDLTPDSALERSADQVREHNARLHARFADDPRTAPTLAPDSVWNPFP